MTREIRQQFNTTESRVLVPLSKLDEFLLHSQVLVQSATVLGIFQNTNRESPERNEDRSQNECHPEVDATVNRFPRTVIPDPDAVIQTLNAALRL